MVIHHVPQSSHRLQVQEDVVLHCIVQHGPAIAVITVVSASQVTGNARHIRWQLVYTALILQEDEPELLSTVWHTCASPVWLGQKSLFSALQYCVTLVTKQEKMAVMPHLSAVLQALSYSVGVCLFHYTGHRVIVQLPRHVLFLVIQSRTLPNLGHINAAGGSIKCTE